jgi:osmotically-inducible protein OsmY
MRFLSIAALAAALVVTAQQPDNTKVNDQDAKNGSATADQQGNSQADVERTAAIRRAVHERTNFSTYAQNVKIITMGGKVTLRGPVRDETEKEAIASIAANIAGPLNVQNELSVAPEQK